MKMKWTTRITKRQASQIVLTIVLLSLCLEGLSLLSESGWLSQLDFYPDHAHHRIYLPLTVVGHGR